MKTANSQRKWLKEIVDFRLRLSYSCFFPSLIILVKKKITIWGRSRKKKKHSSKLSGRRRLRRRFVVATGEFVMRIIYQYKKVPVFWLAMWHVLAGKSLIGKKKDRDYWIKNVRQQLRPEGSRLRSEGDGRGGGGGEASSADWERESGGTDLKRERLNWASFI